MNIAIATTEFVSESNFDGGLANYTYKLAKWLLSEKHEVTVFLTASQEEVLSFDGITINKVKIPDLQWEYKYRFERFKLGFLMNRKTYYRLGFLKNGIYINKSIEKSHRQKKFDIVHYPHISGLALYCPPGLPCVVRLSSSTRLCQEFGGYGENNLSVKIQEEVEIAAMKKATAVFGPSKMIASLTEKDIHRPVEIIETPYVRPQGELDASLLKQHLQGKRYLLFFGSIGLIKGVGTIAEMIYDLFKTHPDLHFVFVGKKVNNQLGNKSLWDYLADQAKEYQDRIIHLEPVKHHRLFPVIQHAECVVLPSRVDNFPNTCIEAMANGKIVIGTYGNGFDQLIEDGKSGFLIHVDDHKELLAKINAVLRLSSAEREKIEKSALERAELLKPDIVLNELVGLYNKTISNFKS